VVFIETQAAAAILRSRHRTRDDNPGSLSPQMQNFTCFHLSCRFYKIRGIKRKKQQLEAPEIVYIKKAISYYVSKACGRFQLPKSIRAACESSNILIWKNF